MAVNFTTSPSNKALFGYCVPKSSLPSSKDRFRFFPSSSSSSEGSQSRATATEDEPQDDAGNLLPYWSCVLKESTQPKT